MQKTKTIHIGTRSFTLKELPVRQVWELINNEQGEQTGFTERFQELLALACPELSKEVLLDLYPSEIEELWQGFEEVNAAFLGAIRLVGMDQAMIGAIKEVVMTSIGRFVALLPMATTVQSSGTTATASS